MTVADYTRITVARADLAEVCKLGFMAVRIGESSCEGCMLTARLSQLTVEYRTTNSDE